MISGEKKKKKVREMEQREKSSKDVVSSGVWLNVESLEKLEGNQSYAKLSAGARILSRSISPPWAWGCKEGRASPAFAESAACGPRAELLSRKQL